MGKNSNEDGKKYVRKRALPWTEPNASLYGSERFRINNNFFEPIEFNRHKYKDKGKQLVQQTINEWIAINNIRSLRPIVTHPSKYFTRKFFVFKINNLIL